MGRSQCGRRTLAATILGGVFVLSAAVSNFPLRNARSFAGFVHSPTAGISFKSCLKATCDAVSHQPLLAGHVHSRLRARPCEFRVDLLLSLSLPSRVMWEKGLRGVRSADHLESLAAASLAVCCRFS